MQKYQRQSLLIQKKKEAELQHYKDKYEKLKVKYEKANIQIL